MQENNLESTNATVIKTDTGSKNGQNKCPKCGATDISLNSLTGKLRCHFCRHEFEPEKILGLATDISKIEGQIIGSGAQDIIVDTNDILTFQCSSCGAEVVIDTASSTQARCHWCRNTLSVNEQISNGAIPDVVLPFTVTKEVAKKEIEKFVGKRKFYAHPKFKAEFTTQNIMGVYFPYMIVDVNAHVNLAGQGEHLVKKYITGSGQNARTYYDADVYQVEREFDLTINGLTVESNAERRSQMSSDKTNNIINAIMPFDIENCVKYNANYLKGYTSERRNMNIEQLKSLVELQSRDIARFSANQTLKEYNRGVAWKSEHFEIKGEQWKAAYLPVWLYSYQQIKGSNKVLHYVAVNARTKETMGSVPIHMPKLLGISFLIEVLEVLAMIYIDFEYNWIFALVGVVYFMIMSASYRNFNARHMHESETKSQIAQLRKVDHYITRKKGLTNSKIAGANNHIVSGTTQANPILDSITEKNPLARIIKDNVNKNGGSL